MKQITTFTTVLLLMCLVCANSVMAQRYDDRDRGRDRGYDRGPSAADCDAMARRSARNSGGMGDGRMARGALRGAVVGRIVGGKRGAKRGAALGMIAGGARRSRARNQTYDHVYDDCMYGRGGYWVYWKGIWIMKRNISILFISVFFSLPMAAWAEEKSEAPDMADVNDYTCRDILLANGDERDLAIMFIQGFYVGKSGKTSFDRNKLAEATDTFLDLCIDKPDGKVMATMEKALKSG
jgi:hypothetical protein